MNIQRIRGLPWLLALMLGIFIDPNEAYKLAEKLQPQGPLGVTLDYALALAWPTAAPGTASNIRRTWMFSTHLSFREPVSTITDAQLWQIARDAAREVETDMGQYDIGFNPRNRPTAMTVLAFDHELILASSLKGDSFTYEFGDSPVLEALQRCQAAWRDDEPARDDKPHRTHGRCGEIMAAHLYYMSHGKTSSLSERNARVGTVLAANQKKGANLKATDPCGERDAWGCDMFVKEKHLKVLDGNITPETYDLESLAGGVVSREQIEVCVTRDD